MASYLIMVEQGISIMGIEIKLGFKRTSAQDLVLATGVLMTANMAWLFSLTSLIPQYTSYGAQTSCGNMTPMGPDCTGRPDLIFSCQVSSDPGNIN